MAAKALPINIIPKPLLSMAPSGILAEKETTSRAGGLGCRKSIPLCLWHGMGRRQGNLAVQGFRS